MADWELFFDDKVDDPGPFIEETGRLLEKILNNRPQADQELQQILAKRLETEIGPKTWDNIRTDLKNYLGKEAADMVSWVITQGDQPDSLEKLEKSAPPKVTAMLRAILGLFGTDAKLANIRAGESPDDWLRIEREISDDLLSERVVVKVRIEKYSGETVVFEGPANSTLELTTNLLRSCCMVGKASAFAPRLIDKLAEECESFLKLYDHLLTGMGSRAAFRHGKEASGRVLKIGHEVMSAGRHRRMTGARMDFKHARFRSWRGRARQPGQPTNPLRSALRFGRVAPKRDDDGT